MKELNRKVFITIFSIISLFLLSIIIFNNVQSYKKEYDNVLRNLNIMETKLPFDNRFVPNQRNFDNMMIMDYEVYTVKLYGEEIEQIISHSNEESDFDVETIAKSIIGEEKTTKIGNLFNNGYAYNYRFDNTIIIINTKSINNKLVLNLVVSIMFFVGSEIIVFFASRAVTNWIIKPAKEALEKQKDFIADASHELKTPIAVIMASSDELKSDKKNSKYVENIKYESERMSKLITSLLDLSKLESGVSKSTYKDEDVSKIILKTASTFEAVAFEDGITIDTEVEDNIIFNCSKDEIEKLVSILIDNAIKHSYKDSSIKVIVKRNKSKFDIDIINNGDPIKDGDEEKIFERFYRADKSRNRGNNRYGLGLGIAKNIVINHNGTIKAYSKDGFTTFKINFK